jgi:hypothetical protein
LSFRRKLGEIGTHGNGHMLMIEENNRAIAVVISTWLDKSVR